MNHRNKAVQARDIATIENLLSAGAALHCIGTAERESWHGDVLRRGIGDHFDAVRKSLEDQGGTLVKSLRDGTMTTFTTARATVNAAQSIRREAITNAAEPILRLRIGLHTGEVIENKGDFFGTVVDKAARINSAAAPDEIRVSDATKIILARAAGIGFDDPQEMLLKGLDGLHRVYRLNY